MTLTGNGQDNIATTVFGNPNALMQFCGGNVPTSGQSEALKTGYFSAKVDSGDPHMTITMAPSGGNCASEVSDDVYTVRILEGYMNSPVTSTPHNCHNADPSNIGTVLDTDLSISGTTTVHYGPSDIGMLNDERWYSVCVYDSGEVDSNMQNFYVPMSTTH